MKRLFIAMLCAWLGGALSAQNQPSLDALTRGILSDLDKSSLQTGILLQQAPMWVNPFRYDGTALHDSNAVSASTFGRLFGQLRAAAVGQSVLPPASIYLDDVARLRQQRSDTVLLALMHLQFEYIVSAAFTQGMLAWGSDQKAHDVVGRTQSPYQRDTTFVFAALTNEVAGHEVVFQLPLRLMFQNLGQPAADVEVDFADGQGWRVLYPDECVRVNYTDAGQKDIRLRLHRGNQIWQAHSRVEVSVAVVAERYSNNPDEIVNLGGTTLSFFFDCEDQKLRKPLIVVEGFGGDATTFAKLMNLIGEAGSNGTLIRASSTPKATTSSG